MHDQLPTVDRFHRSSFCGDCNCVEVTALPNGQVAIRDSKDARSDAPVLRFTQDEWSAFLRGVRAGEFSYAALAAGQLAHSL
jgi:hypothetical protein